MKLLVFFLVETAGIPWRELRVLRVVGKLRYWFWLRDFVHPGRGSRPDTVGGTEGAEGTEIYAVEE